MAGFGLPNFGQLTEAFKKAQELQQNAQKLQEELGQMEVGGQSGGGLVKVTVNGKGELKGLKIDPSLMKAEEREVLEDLLRFRARRLRRRRARFPPRCVRPCRRRCG